MQPAKEVAERVARRSSRARFRDGVENEDQQELQAVGDENLLLVLEDDVIVGHSPRGGVVLESGVEERAEYGQDDLLIGTGCHVGDGLDTFHGQNVGGHVHGLARQGE